MNLRRSISVFRYAARKFFSAIVAANRGGQHGWRGVQSNRNEDALNKDYQYARGDVIERSQDLDVNNPDVGGFHRTRVAQILGAGVTFEHAAHAEEVGLTTEQVTKISTRVNRLREIHSRTGGFDSTGHRRSEGKQQERAYLTALVNGDCLIHRVWRPQNPIVPLSLEIIPGVRISTPNGRAGDPLLSYGIEYADEHRTEVVAFHVRRVSKSIGDSFVPDYQWDRLPVEDCAYLSLTEQAGIDRALPLSVRVARMMRNRSEFIESAVESARAQAKHYGVTNVGKGANQFDVAQDDSSGPDGKFIDMGEGVMMLYTANAETVNWSSAKLPDPDFSGFMDKTDERAARGLNSSKSRFTRTVNSSWAGGRMEDQQDDPLIEQYRDALVTAWQRVNEWFLEAVWLSDAIDLPGYNDATRPYWNEFSATFPGRVHINPLVTQQAREKGLMQRSTTPQRICKEDGLKLRKNLIEWAKFYQMRNEIAADFKIDAALLDVLFEGKTVSTSAGEEIASPTPEPEKQPGDDDAVAGGH